MNREGASTARETNRRRHAQPLRDSLKTPSLAAVQRVLRKLRKNMREIDRLVETRDRGDFSEFLYDAAATKRGGGTE